MTKILFCFLLFFPSISSSMDENNTLPNFDEFMNWYEFDVANPDQEKPLITTPTLDPADVNDCIEVEELDNTAHQIPNAIETQENILRVPCVVETCKHAYSPKEKHLCTFTHIKFRISEHCKKKHKSMSIDVKILNEHVKTHLLLKSQPETKAPKLLIIPCFAKNCTHKYRSRTEFKIKNATRSFMYHYRNQHAGASSYTALRKLLKKHAQANDVLIN